MVTEEATPGGEDARRMLNKVPEVTIFFWTVKIMATTVGETAADFLNFNLNLGLTGTSVIMGALLLVSLVIQFRQKFPRAGDKFPL
jgi:uncharacterized membrane-anchored protein